MDLRLGDMEPRDAAGIGVVVDLVDRVDGCARESPGVRHPMRFVVGVVVAVGVVVWVSLGTCLGSVVHIGDLTLVPLARGVDSLHMDPGHDLDPGTSFDGHQCVGPSSRGSHHMPGNQ